MYIESWTLCKYPAWTTTIKDTFSFWFGRPRLCPHTTLMHAMLPDSTDRGDYGCVWGQSQMRQPALFWVSQKPFTVKRPWQPPTTLTRESQEKIMILYCDCEYNSYSCFTKTLYKTFISGCFLIIFHTKLIAKRSLSNHSHKSRTPALLQPSAAAGLIACDGRRQAHCPLALGAPWQQTSVSPGWGWLACLFPSTSSAEAISKFKMGQKSKIWEEAEAELNIYYCVLKLCMYARTCLKYLNT